GFISPESLENLEDLNVLSPLQREGTITIHRTIIASRQGILLESELEAPALSVSRSVLDHLLIQEAKRSGVDVVEGTSGEAHQQEAPITVVANGRLAHLREKKS